MKIRGYERGDEYILDLCTGHIRKAKVLRIEKGFMVIGYKINEIFMTRKIKEEDIKWKKRKTKFLKK